MRRISLFILVACSSLTLGIITSLTWHSISRSSANNPTTGMISFGEIGRRRYERGPAGEATRGSFITLRSSDGMSFTKWSVYCRSTKEATLKLEKVIRSAVKIVSREPVYDQNSQQIGEKVVALFAANDSQNSPASLLWTEKEEFFQVEGSSLENIFQYRKDFSR